MRCQPNFHLASLAWNCAGVGHLYESTNGQPKFVSSFDICLDR